ncbi:mobile element transfer protein [Streptomyces litchfieldiae]|uniref:Mobile element transfer protein n=1 Tax=Streptomyces litchfieldiae TaxID=3075543 RepID=A0ABU2N1U5_9ACTN|nr:mobile element transfer protein [Streptomyces sp. DSM 44938]MDT0347488.1 mobile element transfer protein [Streptomyces sp. DSM 44938]
MVFKTWRRRRIGPVEVAPNTDRRTRRNGYLAACTRDGCGWSAHYTTEEAAELASTAHRCNPT